MNVNINFSYDKSRSMDDGEDCDVPQQSYHQCLSIKDDFTWECIVDSFQSMIEHMGYRFGDIVFSEVIAKNINKEFIKQVEEKRLQKKTNSLNEKMESAMLDYESKKLSEIQELKVLREKAAKWDAFEAPVKQYRASPPIGYTTAATHDNMSFANTVVNGGNINPSYMYGVSTEDGDCRIR